MYQDRYDNRQFNRPIQTILTNNRPIRSGSIKPKSPIVIINDENSTLEQPLVPKKLQMILVFILFSLLGYCIFPWYVVKSCSMHSQEYHGICVKGYLICFKGYKMVVNRKGEQICVLDSETQQLITQAIEKIVHDLKVEQGKMICLHQQNIIQMNPLVYEKQFPVIINHKQDFLKDLSKEQERLNYKLNCDNYISINKQYAIKPWKCVIDEFVALYWKEMLIYLFAIVLLSYCIIKIRLNILQRNLANQLFKEWKQKLNESDSKSIDINELKLEAEVEFEKIVDENLWKMVEKMRQKHGGKIFLGPGYWILNKV